MIRQHIKDRASTRLLTDALLDYAPDIAWALVRATTDGFWLVIFSESSEDLPSILPVLLDDLIRPGDRISHSPTTPTP